MVLVDEALVDNAVVDGAIQRARELKQEQQDAVNQQRKQTIVTVATAALALGVSWYLAPRNA